MALNNDESLVIFSPFNEPSGAAYWKNYAPSYFSGRGSGISFDWHVHIPGADTNEPQGCWPGTDSIFMQESGTFHKGYRVQGTADVNSATTNLATSKALLAGNGGYSSRQILTIPAIALSGFTIGYWISPQSDGFVTPNSLEITAKRHAVIQKGATVDALYLGVSGLRSMGAQFSESIFPSGLRAFAVVTNTTAASVRKIDIPIESGAYTHITFTYKYFGTANEITLYKNGVSGAAIITATQLVNTNSQWSERPLSIGGCIDTNVVTTDRYDASAGFGHLISGVYAYDRVLTAAEIAQIHNQGGLQVDPTLTYPLYQSVNITDPTIVSYVPFISPGFIDVSRHHLNLFSNQDEGVLGQYVICPGPFNRAMAFNDTTSSVDLAIATPSGTITELLYGGNGSFTIAGWFFMDDAAATGSNFDNSTLFSFGAIGSTNEFNPVRQTGGFQVSASGAANNVRLSARIYDGGLVTLANTTLLTHQDNDLFLSMARHVGLTYDDQTNGVALYVDGNLAQSGTLPSSMLAQMRRLAGSGYPLVFLGGIPGETTDVYSNLAGDDCAIGEIFIANRPLLPAEMKFIAESGIDISPLYYSVHDPRLRGFWKCTGSGTNDLIIKDSCMIFTSGGIPAHLTQSLSDDTWDLLETSDTKGPHYRIDRLSQTRDIDRGVTSGSWSLMTGSDGIPHAPGTTGEWSRTSSTDFCQRFRMFADERDLRAPAHINEYIIGFKVTPSGTITNSFGQTGKDFNCPLFYYGETGAANDQLMSYLTNANQATPGSGLVIVFQSQDGATLITPLISGTLPYGTESNILFHARPLLPFNNDTTTPIETTLFINGSAVNKNTYASNAASGPAARLYDSDSPGTNDNWNIQIGGRALGDTFNGQQATQDGLGGSYMRDIYVMIGTFSANDILNLAASGINANKTINNYSNTLPMATVRIDDTNLEGYWRFSGPDSASGVTDIGSKGNNLRFLARDALGDSNYMSNPDNCTNNLRFVPGPFLRADLDVQCSGITYAGNIPFNAANQAIAPYAVSGAAFQSPHTGFSVGFWMAARESVAANDAVVILSYGVVPSSVTSTTFTDSSWAIEIDDDNNITMLLSQDGKMKLSNVATPKSSQSRCSILRTPISDPGPDVEVFRRGYFNPGHIDGLEHIVFTFNHSNDTNVSGILKGYLNGEKVAETVVPASGFHNPMVVDSRFISFLVPQTGVWGFNTGRAALNTVLFETFYFSRPLADEEVRYITFNGITLPVPTETSGAIGGFASGVNGAIGTIGGYIDGDPPAITTISGHIGGYISSNNVASGAIGGWSRGVTITSGTIGGYISSKTIVSGVMGGYSRGTIRNTFYFDAMFAVEFFSFADFDLKFRIDKTDSADFDIQLIVYQDEQPPDIDIIVPNATLIGTSIPWNQYFVGSGRALQGKSIVQAKWSFSDFTAPVVVSESGNNLYPVEHVFSQSGLYVVRFSTIDSNGQHNSATRIINLSSGVTPVEIALSGAPTAGIAPLSVQFNQVAISTPNNVAIVAQLLNFDDGQESITNNPLHIYTEAGIYRPIWIIRDSRGLVWSDSLVAGVNN